MVIDVNTLLANGLVERFKKTIMQSRLLNFARIPRAVGMSTWTLVPLGTTHLGMSQQNFPPLS